MKEASLENWTLRCQVIGIAGEEMMDFSHIKTRKGCETYLKKDLQECPAFRIVWAKIISPKGNEELIFEDAALKAELNLS